MTLKRLICTWVCILRHLKNTILGLGFSLGLLPIYNYTRMLGYMYIPSSVVFSCLIFFLAICKIDIHVLFMSIVLVAIIPLRAFLRFFLASHQFPITI